MRRFVYPDRKVSDPVQRQQTRVVSAVAALFNPVRRRVHAFVDRRFDRTHYDAAKVVEGFSVLHRQDLDLDGLTDDLCGVAVTTLRPSMASVWLAATGRTPDGW
jgi:hypothetical protein